MKELEAYRRIILGLPEGIQEAEVEAEKNDRISAGITNGEEAGMSASDKTAIFVRATGAKTGMTYTQNLEADPKAVLLEALHNSEFVQGEKPELLNGSNVENSSGVFQELQELEHIPFNKLLEKAAELERVVKEAVPDASHIAVKVSENLRTSGIVNSLGLNRTFTKRIAEADLVLIYEKDIHCTLELETSAPSVSEIPIKYFIDKIEEWLNYPTNKCGFSSTTVPAVINGSVMCNIFLTAWQMFSGYHYINKSTPFYGELGKKLFPDILNISDIPDDPRTGYGKLFDCEGTTSKRVNVIQNGKINELMHNLTTASKLGEQSTGNAGRDVNLISDQTECKVIPSNFTLLPGRNKKEELLANLEDGIYICESYDMFHSVNTASGDFTIPCQGICYRNGKPVGRVEGITMNGNLIELLKNITMVADDITTVSMVMSKSFAISAVSVFVKSLMISGGQIENE